MWALALVTGVTALLRGNNATSPEGDCVPPAHVEHEVHNKHQLSLLSRSASDALYGAESESELNMFVYDCNTHKQLLFLHIPKNAGTSIEDLANKNGVKWGRFSLPAAVRMRDGNTCTGWHTPPSEFKGHNPYANAEVFCVTRDPWDRMVSEYVYLLSCKWGWEMPYLRDAPECSAAGLNTFVSKTVDRMNHGSRWMDDCHMLPQWDYIQGKERTWCQHPLPITHLTDEFNNLMEKSHISFRMAAHHKSNSATSYCPQLNTKAPKELFTPETVAKMRMFYHQDFEHLGDHLDTVGPLGGG